MKLLTKSTYYYLLFSVLAMLGGGLALFHEIHRDIYRQIDNSLITEKGIIQDQLELTDTIPDFTVTFGHQIDVRFLDEPAVRKQVIKDTIMHDDVSNIDLPYRYIKYTGNTSRKKSYSISVFQVLTEKLDFLEAISFYTFFMFLFLLLISLLFNYLTSRKLWSPFYKSVEEADRFNILADEPLDLPDTDIFEFQQLNRVFERMTQKMRKDYLNLKEFNENAAHEIQTPLAIIRSKMELLMQNKSLNKESLNLIKSINEATTRLFKLNQGLLIISKIENQYYHENKRISLREKLESGLENYREIMQLKNITVEVTASSQAFVKMNEVLSDILISNLLSNAVRYNIDNGFIKCQIDNHNLTITNTGLKLNTDPELLFRRFHRSTDNPQSVGLGLSIVKKIADNYGMQITYTYIDSQHEVKVDYQADIIS